MVKIDNDEQQCKKMSKISSNCDLKKYSMSDNPYLFSIINKND